MDGSEPPLLQRYDDADDTDQPKPTISSVRKSNADLRLKGRAYQGFEKLGQDANSNQTKARSAREMKSRCVSPACAASRKRKCNEISEEQRQNLFDNFWQNMSWDEKKIHISGLVDSKPTKEKKAKSDTSRRAYTYSYHLEVEGSRQPVCQTMFLNTFDLKQTRVLDWKSKSNDQAANPVLPPTLPKPKSVKVQIAEDFVDCLQTMPSHYCRQDTSRVYLTSDIRTKRDLYRSFNSWCAQTNVHPVPGDRVLDKVLEEKRISLFMPKKDQCDTCVSYKEGNVSEEEYQAHTARKNRAREEKHADKFDGDDTHSVWVMDVQAVLICPRLYASALYYKTKLASHNFTMYNLKTKHVKCFYWHEAEGDVSANTFASCIRNCLADILSDPQIVKITIFSDGCGYQNRNSTLSNVMLDFAVANKIEIVQKYLEKGHTQMEVDNVHSCVEQKLKRRNIYYPGQYADVFRECRPEQQYEVLELTHDFFFDFRAVKYIESIRPGRSAGDPVVHDLRVLRYTGVPGPCIEYKISFDDNYQELPQRIKMPRENWEISRLFADRLPIKKTKFEHLQQLKPVMPELYHQFYDNLPYV